MGVKASCVCADYTDALIVAGGNTAAAENTFVVVSYHMSGGVVKLINGLVTVVSVGLAYTVFKAELLKLTAAASYAGEAFSFVG